LTGLWLVLADFLDPGRGPKQTGDFEVDPKYFFALLGIGFVIALIGHIARSRLTIAIGLGMIFLATVLIPLGINVAH
jgi:hypothetical protein